MTSQLDELDQTLRELEAMLATAAPEERPTLEMQLASVRSTREMLARMSPQMDASRAARPALSPEVQTFYQPDPVTQIATPIRDDARYDEVTDAAMGPAEGAVVYRLEGAITCARPGVPGVRASVAHGLTLTFSPLGRLASQRLFREGCLVWSIDYHATGGREHSGAYAATERLEYPEEGQHTWFSPGGRVVRQSYHRAGRPHGWTKRWEDDGFPISATLYVDGEVRDEILADGSRPGR